ncbi:FMN-dependent oxidoreductase, nitrilotriacetate monooxygenase family [Arboricoccus pini]|uniref:FMN-dependent oxidoreductase, nitrilotriacetate monooxygenase family n=1 Tax=Arboricoccus pini TaxID=1963835 RepID=A0A212RKV9_9PROT|nr:NtaA/DmoA family FMN-dependent monooxygenase [Arboricoccus pini]SNB72949.1 FMN-dependent oxidoreductase, nitrilotriacetate monooxygenase family [Arboricoccus pini]
MRKRLVFNAFEMNAVSHVYHGLWRHPANRQTSFNTLAFWTDLARTLERGRFDALFLADVVGIDKGHNGGRDTYFKEGIHLPANDPAILSAALIGATSNLGLMFTSSILQSHPFDFARRVSTLDHLSDGRIGWNIVTTTSRNAARNFGFDEPVAHDERYAWADEYVEVVYKLWEGSWEDGAVLNDPAAGGYANSSLIHEIGHRGQRYRVEGPHLSSPSPQRTPVLIQAGSSKAGRAFAARNAEATFVVCLTPEAARVAVNEIRRDVVAAGRDPSDLLFFQGLSFVIGSTEEEAWRKSRALDEYVSTDGLAAHVGRDLGIDFGRLDPERPVADYAIEGLRGFTQFFEEANPGRKARLIDLVTSMSYNGRIVGTPEQIADSLEAWQDAGIDGINVAYQTAPGSFVDVVDHLMPVLRARGLAQIEYAPGTLRERLFPGRPATLQGAHPATRYRRVAENASAALAATGRG